MKKQLLFILLLLCCAFSASAKKKETRTVVQLETSMGTFKVALYDETPIHRDNFTRLVESGFYENTCFHRVIKDFMIQGGESISPNNLNSKREETNGTVESTLPPEFRVPLYYHKRGALAMARESDEQNPERHSSGSQFYVVWGKIHSEMSLAKARAAADKQVDGNLEFTYDMRETYLTKGGTPHLDGQYTVFGEVIEGLPIVGKIQKINTDSNDRPVENVILIKAIILQYSQTLVIK